jgi:hypothetical protein
MVVSIIIIIKNKNKTKNLIQKLISEILINPQYSSSINKE